MVENEEIHIHEPENALPRLQLDDLPEDLRAACGRANWQQLMPVQALTLPYLLAGRDIMVQSRTGSGKTGCYLLPLLPKLLPEKKGVQALILLPTRELALQVEREAQTIFADTGLVAVAVYGGVGYKTQRDALQAGAQIVVGTPGRILDHILRRTLDLQHLRALVFDEADRMLSIGFYPDMKEVQRHLPRKHVHTALFSATYPPHVLKLAAEFMEQPDMLSLSQKEVHVAEVQHLFCEVKPMDKDRALIRLLETENPVQAMIFCNTKVNVHYMTAVLQGFGYSAEELSSDLSQSKREAVLSKIREGSVQFLVATDVAARGIDIPDLSHVILFEPPEDHESYIHRAGRTGRAGAAGTVISLVDVMQRMELDRIACHYKIPLREIAVPSDKDVATVASSRLTAILEKRFRGLTGLERLRIERYVPLVREFAKEGDEGANVMLLAMLLDACHQQSLHENFLPTGQRTRSIESGRRGGRRVAREQRPALKDNVALRQEEDPGQPKRRRRRRSKKSRSDGVSEGKQE